MKRYTVFGALALTALAAGAGWLLTRHGRRPAPAAELAGQDVTPAVDLPGGPATWLVGSRRVYRFGYHASGAWSMDGSPDKGGKLAMSLEGTLTTTVTRNDLGSRTLEFQVAAERLDLHDMPSSVPVATIERDLERPFAVTFGEEGDARNIALPASITRQAGTLLRDIVSQIQVTVRPSAAWVATETEPAGECLVSLRRLDSSHIAKQKLRFVRVSRSGKLLAAEATVAVPIFTRSSATYEVDGGGRVRSARVNHAVSVTVDVVGGSARSEVRASFAEVSSTRVQPSVPADLVAARSLTDRPEDAPAGSDREELPSVKQLLSNVNRTDAMTDAGAMHLAQHQLSRVIARDPSSLSKIPPGEMSQPVLSAIGSAGSPEAQAQLVHIAADPKQALAVRKQAIDAFHEVPDATAEAMTKLIELADKSQDLRENALLAMGALVNRMRASDPSGAEGWADDLASRYQQATTDAERIQVLDALGNSADARAFDVIEAALASPSLALRVAAARNLRLLPAPRADQLLGLMLAPTSAPEIRTAALFATGFRQFGPMRAALEPLIRSDPSAEVRVIVLSLLATFLGRDGATEVKPIIAWVAEHDPEAHLREQARLAIEGRMTPSL